MHKLTLFVLAGLVAACYSAGIPRVRRSDEPSSREEYSEEYNRHHHRDHDHYHHKDPDRHHHRYDSAEKEETALIYKKKPYKQVVAYQPPVHEVYYVERPVYYRRTFTYVEPYSEY